MAKTKSNGHRTIIYNSYNFIDKDPIIDKTRTIVENSGWSWQQIQEESGVSKSTLSAWFLGKTKKPRFCTINAVALVLDMELDFVPVSRKRRWKSVAKA